MQDKETPIEDAADTGTEETIGYVDTEPAHEYTNPHMQAFADAHGLPVGMVTGAALPPEPPEGKYDAVYNREAHSRRTMRHGRKPAKVERMFVRGEQIEVKGELFKVTAVGHKTMTLQLLPQIKVQETAVETDISK